MKRALLFMAAIILTLGLVAGCTTVPTYDDAGHDIDVGLDKEFIIALGSNPTTGYSWQASYDEIMLELVEATYDVDEETEDLVGAGGVEFFRFLTLQAGETEITMTYERSFEDGDPIETKVFTVIID